MKKSTQNHTEFKPWRSYEDQLDILVKNGLEVDERQKALDYLARLGYYRLSGYWYGLRRLDTQQTSQLGVPVRASQFVQNSRFEHVVKLYVFDKKLRLLAMDALERIEMALRVDIAYLLGRYHPLAHKKPEFLHGHFSRQIKKKEPANGRTEHQLWLDKYQSMLFRARREPFIVHNCEKYGEPPIWVAIEVWDFGLMSKLYAGMRHKDQDEIALKYGAKDGRELAAWLRSFNFIRNVSAHHSRLWNINILERSAVPGNEANWQSLRNARPFLYFCLMQKMLKAICPNSSWGNRFLELLHEFPATSGFTLEEMGYADEAWVTEYFLG